MTDYKSRAVRSLVELHEQELRAFMVTWRRFVASGKPMPEAPDDPDYESPERLVAHVQAAARSYMLWIWEMLEHPIEGLPRIREATEIVPRLDAFMEDTLDGWRRHMASLEDAQLSPVQFKTRWGELYAVEQMLEHAVVHPMRHRIQLDRVLAG